MSSVVPSNLRVRLAATLVAVLVILGCVAAIVVGLVTDSSTPASGDQVVPGAALASERSAAMSAANTFVNGQWTFDPSMLQGSTMPAFRAKVEAVITPKYSQTFEQWAAYTEKAVGTGFKGSVQIWATGVAAISADKATVLVVGERTISMAKTKGSSDFQKLSDEPYRLVLSLVKVKGAWLVDNMTVAEGTPSTSASPTSGATK